MKKIIKVLLMIVICVSLIGCGSDKEINLNDKVDGKFTTTQSSNTDYMKSIRLVFTGYDSELIGISQKGEEKKHKVFIQYDSKIIVLDEENNKNFNFDKQTNDDEKEKVNDFLSKIDKNLDKDTFINWCYNYFDNYINK